jgi:hypothetical protein
MKRVFSSFLIVLLCLSLFACSMKADGNSSKSSHSSKSDFVDKTETTVEEMEILPLMVENVVTIKQMELSAGSITLTIYRPDGEIFVQKVYSAPVRTSETIRLEMDQGVWKMKMEYVGATGKYDIRWVANN